MGSFKIFTILAVGVVGSVAMAKPVAGTLIATQIKELITEQGNANLENARMACLEAKQTCLNPNSESLWQDPANDIAGAFKILSTYKNASDQLCREYQHEFRTKNGQALKHNTEASKENNKFGQPLIGKSHACEIAPGQWEKVAAPEAAPAAAAQTENKRTYPEHRREYPNMIGPVSMGKIVSAMEFWKSRIDSDSNQSQDFRRQERLTWINNVMIGDSVGGIRVGKKTMALDQLLIMLEQIEGDASKMDSIEALKPYLVRIGDAARQKGDIDRLMNDIQDKKSKTKLQRLLKALPLAKPVQPQAAS